MPVGEFPGGRNWGYDGVYAYAQQSTYGGPAGLKRLIDACHREGLAVVDRESKTCYLDTSDRRNLAFYERLGFVVVEEATLGKGGPKAWAMRRKPQTSV